MTSLGDHVFIDIYSRHRSSSSSTFSLKCSKSLSLAFENLFQMPFDVIEHFASSVQTLDISHNKFNRNLKFLSEFEHLTSLNLDHNNIDSYAIFPYMPNLRLLWLNHNNINEIFPFLKNLYESVPNLRYLCLMGNKAAPSYLNGGNFYDYLQYRLFVISWFPQLIHLDDSIVTPEQRQEAKRLFKKPIIEQIAKNTRVPEYCKSLHVKIATILLKPHFTTDKIKASAKNVNFIV